jgi:hypothetical protein
MMMRESIECRRRRVRVLSVLAFSDSQRSTSWAESSRSFLAPRALRVRCQAFRRLDQYDFEPVDHRRAHVPPLRSWLWHHDESLQDHARLGSGDEADVGFADDRAP